MVERRVANAVGRSNLVTGLAWVSIVVCALMVVPLGMGTAALFWLVPADALALDGLGPEIPPGFVFALRYLREISLAMLVFCAISLWASIALLRRRNWARLFFVAMLVAGALWSLVSLFFVPDFIPSPEALFGEDVSPDLALQFEQMMRDMIWWSVGTTLVFVVLHGWVAWKLVTSPVKDEFA